MKKILANNEDFSIQSATGGILRAPNVESGEKIIATRDWVDDEINKVSAYYITSNAQGNTFATVQALNAGPWFSGGQERNPTRNDYAIVSAGTPARYIVATVSEQGVPTWVKQYDISSGDYEQLDNKPSVNDVELVGNKTSSDLGLASKQDEETHDARNLRDLDKVYETWIEPLTQDSDRAYNYHTIHFKPSVFGVDGDCVIRKFTIRTSDTTAAPGLYIYGKIYSRNDATHSLATSRPVAITEKDTEYTFVFDEDATLNSESWYALMFHLGAEDSSQVKNFGLRLSNDKGGSQDIYYEGVPRRRPIVKVLFAPTSDKVAYKSKVASKEDAVLTSTWKCNPSTYNDQQITISVQVNDGVTSLIPIIESGIIGNAKPIVNGETQVTWIGGTEWMGTDNLVAKVSHYVLGDQNDKKLQPAGDYLTEEDFAEVTVQEFTAEKITVKDGGVIELNPRSSIKVAKGRDEAKIVVTNGSVVNELTFPEKTGTLAIQEDIGNIGKYISDNGEPFTSKEELDAYVGAQDNDYAFVVATDSGNKTYTMYRYDADATTPAWNKEYTLDCQSFNESQWAAIDSGITKDDVDKLVGVEKTWEDDIGYTDQSGGIQKLLFKPRAFDMVDDACINSITFTNSRTVSTNANVFVKLMDASGTTEYARSNSQNMVATNTPYTFNFDKKVGLFKDTEYMLAFFLAETDDARNVSINLKSRTESPDFHVYNRIDLRPKAVVAWEKNGAYVKPTNGIPKSDLDSIVQRSLEKADESATHDETILTETYGDVSESQWKTNPSQLNGYDITIRLIQSQDVTKAVPYANNQIVAMTPITLQGDEETLTWNPMGSETPFWAGNVPLVATRIGKHLVLGDQTDKKIQPAGNYLLAEDL